MKWSGLGVVFFLIFLCCGISPTFCQSSDPPEIINPVTEPINFCGDSVFFATEVTIQNLSVTDETGGIKISVISFNKDEDVLDYFPVNGLNYYWNEAYGYLLITGIESASKYQEAVRNVYYKNISDNPTLGIRKFTISLNDADYLPLTGHFYQYVKKQGITWTESKQAAESMSYYGLQGYLVTITFEQENDFVWTKMDGIGWIGASDLDEEGVWKWVTGPEAGQQFWQGNQNGQAVNDRFSFWAEGEPNNAFGGQPYAHINQHPEKAPKSWNDLKDDASGSNPDYYTPQGYVVEYGGMPDDPILNLAAVSEINVAKIVFSSTSDYDICYGSGTEIELLPANEYDYSWTPNNSIDNDTVSNPFVNPTKNTQYKVVVKYDVCIDSAIFNVNVNPIPVSKLDNINTICKGDEITLDAGEHTSYLWNNQEHSRTIDVSAEGSYIVRMTNDLGCAIQDTAIVQWSKMPQLDYDNLHTLICGSKETKLEIQFDDPVDSIFIASLQNTLIIDDQSSLNPLISAPDFGTYPIQLFFEDQNKCTSIDTFNLDFHNQPTADFFLDDEKCNGYNVELNYTGQNLEPAQFYWFSNDTVFAEGDELHEINIPLGYGQRNRSVGLQVNEQGCKSEHFVNVSVVPKIDFWVEENPVGCSPLKLNFGNDDVEEIEKYLWEFGDGTTSEEKEPEHIFINEGETSKDFNVQLSVISFEGCENTGFLDEAITVYNAPAIGLNFDEEDCNEETALVWYEGTGNENDTFFWDLSDLQAAEIIQNPGTTAGPLEFKRTSKSTVDIGLKLISAQGCSSKSIVKTWKRKPLFKNSVSIDNAIGCPPLDISFSTAISDNDDTLNYRWIFGDGSIDFGHEISRTVSLPNKNYDLTLVASSTQTQCSDTLFLADAVFSYPVPDASFIANPSSVLISDPVILFENRSLGAESFDWDFNDGSTLTNKVSVEHKFSEMGFFNVQLTAWNEFGCVDTTSRVVAVEFDKIYPPNAFSPNAALAEDREFRLYAEGISDNDYRLEIFNRWGEVIFESNSQNTGWYGKMKNGNYAPTGVYTWVFQYFDIWGKKHNQQGTVTLLH